MEPTLLKYIRARASNLGLKVWCITTSYSVAFADTPDSNPNTGIGAMAHRVQSSLGSIASLIGSLSYVVGLGFFIACLLKFKQHRDNPTQVPIGMPFTYLGIAVLLVFLPNLIVETGNTVFSNATSYGVQAVAFTDIQVTTK